MANDDHIAQLRKGVAAWNDWRKQNPDIRPGLSGENLFDADLNRANLSRANLQWARLSGANLSGADLSKANLSEADLSGANLSGADISRAWLTEADLREANLSEANLFYTNLGKADLYEANLSGANLGMAGLPEADLRGADLREANLNLAALDGANLSGADLSKADLRGADLGSATLVGTNLSGADLTSCRIYGVSAWGVKLEGAKQENLIITPEGEPEIMVDDLEVAQFIYLLLNREKIRNVINSVTRRGVLILGRFQEGGLALLQAVAAWLRRPENGGYLPLLFDFSRPDSKTYTETVRTLVGLARFVIVDLSGPSVPQEITATVDLYEIPFVPILEKERKEPWSMFRDFLVKERVLEPVRFTDQDHLLEVLAKEVIAPAEKLIEKRQKRLDEIFGRAP
jgi:uncharacterized protein YjbI with pentapeptide repeats